MILFLLGCPSSEDVTPLPTPAGEKAAPGLFAKKYCAKWKPKFPKSVTPDATCNEPLTELDPQVEWSWSSLDGVDMNVLSTPVVGPVIEDADGDGRPDENAVVFLAYEGNGWEEEGTLVVLRGTDGSLVWALDQVIDGYGTVHTFSADGGVALGDLNGDGVLDICASGYTAQVICVEADGDFLFAADSGDSVRQWHSAPAIADMKGDFDPEVVIGEKVFDSSGALVGSGSAGSGGGTLCSGARFDVSIPADIDGDAVMELVVGNAVYEWDGTLRWQDTTADSGEDGWPAIVNLDNDAALEIVVSRRSGSANNGWLFGYDTDGTPLWAVNNGGYRAGPPVVANFDYDADPEVAVGNNGSVTVYDVFNTSAPTVRSQFTYSASTGYSSTSGISAFDFTGDGVDELVYDYEDRWHVWDPITGDDLLDFATNLDPLDHQSPTQLEYPAIADVDLDGYTEIVVPSAYDTNYPSATNGPTAWHGIYVIGQRDLPWSTTGGTWSQHAWFDENIDDWGTIEPGAAPDGNHFRAQAVVDPGGFDAADLDGMEAELCPLACKASATSVKVHVAVANYGMSTGTFTAKLMNSGVQVASTNFTLASGAVGTASFNVAKTSWTGTLTLEVDTANAVDECDETNNTVTIGAWPC